VQSTHIIIDNSIHARRMVRKKMSKSRGSSRYTCKARTLSSITVFMLEGETIHAHARRMILVMLPVIWQILMKGRGSNRYTCKARTLSSITVFMLGGWLGRRGRRGLGSDQEDSEAHLSSVEYSLIFIRLLVLALFSRTNMCLMRKIVKNPIITIAVMSIH
jgi:hypothetical protein